MSRKRFSLSLSSFLAAPAAETPKRPRKSIVASLFPSFQSGSAASSARHRTVVTPYDLFESVIFVWFDPEQRVTTNTVNLLRSINETIRLFTKPDICLTALESANEKVFFISSVNDDEFLTKVHDCPAVEAMFIFDPKSAHFKEDLPKICGLYAQQGVLFIELEEALDCFEQIRLEMFYSEEDPVFLWRQIWKEDLLKRKSVLTKQDFLAAVRIYYQSNAQTKEIIGEFEKSYRSSDVFQWCFRSPFPARLLRHAICFQSKDQLELCRFLFEDATHQMRKKGDRKVGTQVYRGMKIAPEHIEHFEQHVGKLICSSGFFPCTKSKTNATELATSRNYRTDLAPVLFTIDCEADDPFVEVANTDDLSFPTIVFDICMTFRVIFVDRGELTIIELKTAGKDGKRIAQEFLAQHEDQAMESLLEENAPAEPLISEPTQRPPRRSDPWLHEPEEIPSRRSVPLLKREKSVSLTDEEEAQQYIAQGQIDLALEAYKRIRPRTARIWNLLGQLAAEKKRDYDYALECFSRGLKMQEENNEDVSETLTHLGNVHLHRKEAELALGYHQRALGARETANPPNPSAIAASLLGIAKVYCLQRAYEAAAMDAEQALSIQQSMVLCDERDVLNTLILLGDIYAQWKEYQKAFDRSTQALALAERISPTDLRLHAKILTSMGNIQRDLGRVDLAANYLERATRIYAEIPPSALTVRFSDERS